jgi:type I restriction enzyme, S subunit
MTSWRKVKLKDLARHIQSGGTPLSTNQEYWNGSIPFAMIEDLTGANKYLVKTVRSITEKGLNSSNTWIVPKGSILYSIYATLGVPIINAVEVATNQAILNIVPNSNVVDTEYLYYWLENYQGKVKQHSAQTTQSNLNAAIVKDFDVLLPARKEEQRKIAQVLSTIDNAITQTEALIAKYGRVRTGLMQDLLTKGIDEQGRVRSEATHAFKDSPLGRVPLEWEVKELETLVSNQRPICYGILMPGYGYEGGVPVIKVKDIKNDTIDRDNLLLTNPKIDEQYKRSRLQAGDLLLTIRGTVGRMAFVPQQLNSANITQDTARVGIVKGDARFIKYYLATPQSVRFMELHTRGVAVQGINLGDVRKIPIAFPPIDEQVEIANRLDAIYNQINVTESNIAKLKRLKVGLMQDLLTGDKPIDALLEQVESKQLEVTA